jgi:signal-transduction protein with cAMP-binding, CBS, and nucleotidyltransferase domain
MAVDDILGDQRGIPRRRQVATVAVRPSSPAVASSDLPVVEASLGIVTKYRGGMDAVVHDKGEIIYHYNDDAGCVFVIARGVVELQSPKGGLLHLRAHKGDCIGLDALKARGRRDYTAVAVDMTLLFPISKDLLKIKKFLQAKVDFLEREPREHRFGRASDELYRKIEEMNEHEREDEKQEEQEAEAEEDSWAQSPIMSTKILSMVARFGVKRSSLARPDT